MPNDTRYLLTEDALRQLRRDHNLLASQLQAFQGRTIRRKSRGGGSSVVRGITSGTMGARSGDTPGSGTVQPKRFNADTGDYEDDGDTITVRNPFRAVIPDGIWLQYHSVGSFHELITVDCVEP